MIKKCFGCKREEVDPKFTSKRFPNLCPICFRRATEAYDRIMKEQNRRTKR